MYPYMKSTILKQPRVAYPHPATRRELPVNSGSPRGLAYAVLVAKHVIFTVAFVFFCIGIIAAIWYATAALANTSYKMVAFFLILILGANITSRYVIWCIEH
jgi:hypothetical protein